MKARARLAEVGERVARLDEAWDKHEEGARWRAKLKRTANVRRDVPEVLELPADPFAR